MTASSTPPPLPSNTSFGWVFTVFFSLIGGYSLWKQGTLWPWMFGTAGVIAAITLIVPGILTPFNRIWMKFGELLHRIVSPIILGIIFFGVITPFGVVKRMTGWDPMRRKFDSSAKTYWIDRDPPGPAPDSLPNQF